MAEMRSYVDIGHVNVICVDFQKLENATDMKRLISEASNVKIKSATSMSLDFLPTQPCKGTQKYIITRRDNE